MASSFPTTFENNSQSQHPQAGSNPVSYQANVNRQKTRKWVDAKTPNYGGDDWGDDSDEYDDYDEPPAPVSKQPADSHKKSYGNLPPAPEARLRSNSFDADDEKRNFSNQTVVPPAQTTPSGPPTRFSQITGIPSVRQPSGAPPPPLSMQQEGHAGNPQPGMMSSGDPNIIPSASSDGRFSTGDYQARRDYSPTAAPAPLNSRSPGPQSAVDSPSSRFPARKSSISHPSGPRLAEVTRSPEEVQTPSKPMSPTAASTGKALPFVRPADIYRRAEEERRQSIESGSRPTMVSPIGSKPTDRSGSPGLQPLVGNPDSENPGARRRASIDRDESPGGRYLAPGLEPVQERRSEYGFDGFSVTDAPKETGPNPSYGSHPPLSDSAKLDVQDDRRQSTSPKLPDLNRMSGFGMDMFAQPKPDTHVNKLQPSYNQADNVHIAENPSVRTPESSPSPGLHQQGNLMGHDDQLAPPRALTHAPSEQSFRPNIPGGWTSYATTNHTETPQSEDHQTSLQRNPDSDYDIAPTTTKHILPQSASGAALADFETGASRGEHDKNSALPPPPPFSESNNNAMPTPDHDMAPSGNLYSTTTLDPRLLPKSDVEPIGAPPPPPAKDTPVIGSQEDRGGYFPASAMYTTDSKGGSHSLNQPPVLRQGSESDQEENDRLEEEIVSRLSPQPQEATRNNNLLATTPDDTARESTYLPDYYWTSTEDEARTPPLDIGSKQGVPQQTNIKSAHATPTGSVHRSISQTDPVAPLSVAKSEHSTNSSALDRPPVKHRFSWEQSSENVSVAGENREIGGPPSALSTSTSTSALPGSTISTEAQQQQQIHEMPSSQGSELRSPLAQHHDEKVVMEHGSPSTSQGSIDDRHIARASVIMGGAALATAATVAAVEMDSRDGRPERRASLAEEKATRVSSYPVTVTPPEHEHPARSAEPYFSPTSDHPPPSSSVSPINSPTVSQPLPPTSRLLAFKEIMNMKSPHQRIQTFDETRQRFAAMDSGLTNWMEALRAQQPEHATSTGSWATSGPGIGKGANSGGAPAGATQPPYYQQYLNASSPTGTPTSSKPGPSSAAHQGHSSAGGSAPKITTQQVQAKGKEFLHTAGIFGGKAGKVGKGFLAKGKSKFLGGGGDKTTSPPPQPKHERRSSWGLPLSKPKSSGPSDKSNRLSRQITPVPAGNVEHQRSATMTSISSQPPQLPPNASTGDVFGSGTLSGTRGESPAPFSNNLHAHQQGEPITSVREIRDTDQSTTESEIDVEERDKIDSLGPPRPISKHQPFWDPYTATPIAEEQVSALDTRPVQQSYPFPDAPISQPEAKPLDHGVILPNDHANDGQVHQHDTEEESLKNDWVMVTPEVETKEEAPKPIAPPTSMMHRARGSSGDIPILPSQTQREIASPPPAPLIESQSSEDTGAIKFDTREQFPIARTRPEEVQADSTFLPPIRRTSNLSSALAYKFGSRKGKQRFSLDDGDEDGENPLVENGAPAHSSLPKNRDLNGPPQIERTIQQEDSGYVTERSGPVQHSSQPIQMPSGPPRPSMGSTGGSSYEYRQSPREVNTGHTSQGQQQDYLEPRPPLIQASSSDYSQPSVTSEASGAKTPTPADVAPPGALRRSQDAWRPNAPPSIGDNQLPQNIPMPVFAPRQSWELQRPRGGSGSGTNLGFRPEVQQERQWSLQSKTFEQPPSSAQRYPELFRTGQPIVEPHDQNSGDLPAHYYQAPITREAAFLPRQQTNEYQIPGVGPPVDDPRGSSRRNSNFFKDVGGKISRATSRERRKSISQEDEFTPARIRSDSRVNDDADSSIISEDGKEKNKRRSSFFGALGRSSTGLSNAPHSRESIIAHAPSSRTDLVQSLPTSTPQEKKRSFFGGSASTPPVTKPSKLPAASKSGAPEVTTGKKKRFSGFGIFAGRPDSRGSTPDRPQATRESSHGDRQPLDSPSNASNFPSRNQSNRGALAPLPQGQNSQPLQGQQGPPIQHGQYSQPPPQGQSARPLQGQQGPPTQQGQYNQPHRPQIQQGMPTPQYNQPPSRGQQGTPTQEQYKQQPVQSQNGQSFPQAKPEIEQKTSRSFLSKMRTSSTQSPKPQAPQQAPIQPQQQEARPRKASKTRRASAGGLLGGLMGRKHSHDVNSEQPQIQGNQQQARQAPPGRTYSGIGEQQVQNQPTIRQVQAEPQSQNRQSAPPEERGRQTTREQQYDPVPIPTGYNLVRAQGGHTVPTDYDPRGYRSQPSGHQSPPAGQVYGQTSSTPQTSQQSQPLTQQNSNVVSNQAPHISALENYQSFVSRQAPNRLSREDLLARSPALPIEGQQRPYQLSLPENNDERDYPVTTSRSPISPRESSSHLSNAPGKSNTQHDPIQRIQGGPQREITPPLPRSASPAAYPLPDNVVFSPIIPSAEDIPPPPPPKDNHLAPDHARNFSGSSYLAAFNLNRSGTHRTAVSAMSGISSPPSQHARRESDSVISPTHPPDRTADSSPTPPSPVGTPMRIESPDLIVTKPQTFKTTILEAPRRPSLDLYDASPIGTPNTKPHPNGHMRSHSRQRSGPPTPNLTIQTQQPYTTPPTRQAPALSPPQPNSSGSGQKFAELEGTKADGFNMRLTRQEQEEKIFYDAESGMRGYGDAAPSMSATSYPGQEWNPYGAGAWEEGEEEEDVRIVRR